MRAPLLFAMVFVAGSGSIACAQRAPYVSDQVRAWLAQHREYRQLSDRDCRCDDDLKEIRVGPAKRPNYRPYFTTGDFNSDGRIDVAVGVERPADHGEFRVLIINSAEAPNSYRHAYLSKPFDRRCAIFFGPPAAKGSLLVGPFDSEGDRLVPRGRYGYAIDPAEN